MVERKNSPSLPGSEWSTVFYSPQAGDTIAKYITLFFKLTSTFLFILFLHLGILLQMFLIGLQGYFWESEPRIKKRDVTYL